MFESFSQPAVRVVCGAFHEACILGSDFIEPEHLLLGFTSEDQGEWEQAVARHLGDKPILENNGPPFFSPEIAAQLRKALAQSSKPGVPKPDRGDMLFAEGSKQTLLAAKEHARPSKVRLLDILLALVSSKRVFCSQFPAVERCYRPAGRERN